MVWIPTIQKPNSQVLFVLAAHTELCNKVSKKLLFTPKACVVLKDSVGLTYTTIM